jgi:hypothetical protein
MTPQLKLFDVRALDLFGLRGQPETRSTVTMTRMTKPAEQQLARSLPSRQQQQQQEPAHVRRVWPE